MIKITSKNTNYVFEMIKDVCDNKDWVLIDEEIISDPLSFYWSEQHKASAIEAVKPLLGYKVKLKQKGDHKNDGQMVTYKFKFKNPAEEKTEIYTEMCLMCSWNHSDIEIN